MRNKKRASMDSGSAAVSITRPQSKFTAVKSKTTFRSTASLPMKPSAWFSYRVPQNVAMGWASKISLSSKKRVASRHGRENREYCRENQPEHHAFLGLSCILGMCLTWAKAGCSLCDIESLHVQSFSSSFDFQSASRALSTE
jgi:hypothetical protein